MELDQLLRELALARSKQERASSKMRDFIEATKQNIAYLVAESDSKSASEEAEKLRSQIEEIAKVEFAANPDNKTINEAVKIRVMERLEYDQAQAFAWAKEHGLALTLDKKAFDGLAKAESTRPEFVKVAEETTVTIAQDLSKYLEA